MTYLEHAERLWPILAGLSVNRERETYGRIGRRLGIGAQNVSGALAPIHTYCEANGLPLLTALVVQSKSGHPGPGYRCRNDHPTECERVFTYDWAGVVPPTAVDLRPLAKRI